MDLDEPSSRSMSIDSGYVEDRERTSSILSIDYEITQIENIDQKENTTNNIQTSKCIAIEQKSRTREMTIDVNLPRTPTPSKYYIMLQENDNLIHTIHK
jgi:hypothetical protein